MALTIQECSTFLDLCVSLVLILESFRILESSAASRCSRRQQAMVTLGRRGRERRRTIDPRAGGCVDPPLASNMPRVFVFHFPSWASDGPNLDEGTRLAKWRPEGPAFRERKVERGEAEDEEEEQ